MTGFGWGEINKQLQRQEADFSTAAAKCAAFGRNDGVWVGGARKTGNGNSRFLHCGGKVRRLRSK